METQTYTAASFVSKRLSIFLLLSLLSFGSMAQKVVSSAGKDGGNATGSVSFTLGEPAVMVLSPDKMSNEGVQQPYRDDSLTYEREVCQNESYSDETFTITEAQTSVAGVFQFRDTMLNANRFGGDSIIVLSLTIHPAVELTVASHQDVDCYGMSSGSIVLSTTLGTPSYAYSLNGGEPQATSEYTGLAAGDYKVIVTDAKGCLDSVEISLIQPDAALQVSVAASESVICGGVTATLSSTTAGGTTPYAYLWSADNVSAGLPDSPVTGDVEVSPTSNSNYTLTVTDALGCTATDEVSISASEQPELVIESQTNNPCYGFLVGSVTLGVTNGSGTYTYALEGVSPQSSPLFVNLAAGDYIATATDANGCVSSPLTVVISQPEAVLSVSASAVLSNVCQGDSVLLTSEARGGTPGEGSYDYLWTASPAGSGLPVETEVASIKVGPQTSTLYTLKVTDANGCTDVSTVTVTVHPRPLLSIPAYSDVTCYGLEDGSITIAASQGDGSYTYMLNGSAAESNNSGLASGTYEASVTDGKGCVSDVVTVIISEPEAIELTAVSKFGVICMGAKDTLSAHASGGTGDITYSWSSESSSAGVFDPIGKAVEVAPTATSTYVVTAKDANECPSTVEVSVTVRPLPTAVVKSKQDIKCHGDHTGSFTLTVTNGLGTSSYDTTFSNLGAALWRVSIQDEMCIRENAVEVPILHPVEPLLVMASPEDGAVCPDGSIVLTAEAHGGTQSGYVYEWSSNDALAGLPAVTDLASIEVSPESESVYEVLVTDANGCKASTTATVTMKDSTMRDTFAVACDSYSWREYDDITESTILTHTETKSNGCDSVIILHLTVNHSNTGDTTANACDQFKWYNNPMHMVSSGKRSFTETHTFTNIAGCDSVVTLHLTVSVSNSGIDTKDVCDSLLWIDGITYRENTSTPTHTLTNIYGCDSLVTLHLTLRHAATGIDAQTPCDSLVWLDGTTYTTNTTSAIHRILEAAQNGCDSVVTLHLTLRHGSSGIDLQHACENYLWIDGTTYGESTSSATFTTTNAAGCDSLVTLNLTLGHNNTGIDIHESCDSFLWIDGVYYFSDNNSTTYKLEHANSDGCDSVVTLHLTIAHSSEGTDIQSACDTYEWIDGTTYTASISGATYTLQNAINCDSVVTLHLTMGHSNTGTEIRTECGAYTWIDGVTYTESAIASYTLPNASNCDSVVTLDLTVSSTDTVYIDTASVCAGDRYVSDGFNTPTVLRTVSQRVFDTLYGLNSLGCDSLTILRLMVNPVDSNEIVDAVNGGQSYLSHSFSIATEVRATDYQLFDTIVTDNRYGCDSSVFLTLTVRGTDSTRIDTLLCDNALPVEWRGFVFNEAGTQSFTRTTSSGSNQVVTLVLTVKNSSSYDTAIVACDSYDWYDRTGLTSSATISRTLYDGNSVGCDSIVTLHLTINRSSSSQFVRRACDSYTWIDGNVYNESNDTATHTIANGNAVGCDSVVHLHLTMSHFQQVAVSETICFNQLPYTWNGEVFDRAGTKSTFLTSSFGCDSNVIMTLVVNSSYTNSDERSICPADLPYVWNDVEFTEVGTKTITLTSLGGCDSTVIMSLKVNSSHHATIQDTACYEYLWTLLDTTLLLADPGFDTHLYIRKLDNGCEAQDTLILMLYPNASTLAHPSACDRYQWSRTGEVYTVDTTVLYSFTDDNGCIGADTLRLTIDHNTGRRYDAADCDSFLWQHLDGRMDTLRSGGRHTYFYYSSNGCPSTDTLDLSLFSGSYDSYAATSCDSFRWLASSAYGHGSDLTYTESGDYVSVYRNAVGCPSVDTLHLSLLSSGSGSDSVHGCSSYVWMVNGNAVDTYTSAGTYYYSSVADNGCPRSDTLVLTLGQGSASTDYRVTCDSLEWIDGVVYTSTITGPTYVLDNASGCDSVVTLDLRLSYATTSTEMVSACERYYWNDSLYTKSTEDVRVFENRYGCDSIAYFSLSIHQSEASVDNRSACDSLVWHNRVYYESTRTPQARLTNRYGCDSVVTLHLTVRHSTSSTVRVQGEGSYIYNGSTYLYSGDYPEVLTNSVGCDSVVTLSVSIMHNKPLPQIQAYENKAVLVNHYPNGADHPRVDYIAYRWFHDGQFISGAIEDYYARKGYAALSGSYYVEVPTDESRTHWVRSNTIEIVASKVSLDFAAIHQLMLYPNPVRRGAQVTLVVAQDENDIVDGSRVVVYDLL
ncbi:MAG: SprB repeat-containing protein [Bacteroidales bacterium]|nr:SprB repeat-containing protein [Bacteroidales bacterium]